MKGRMVLLLSKGEQEMIKNEGLFYFYFLKKLFSGRSLFKSTCLEKQKGAETVRRIAKA